MGRQDTAGTGTFLMPWRSSTRTARAGGRHPEVGVAASEQPGHNVSKARGQLWSLR